MKKVILILGCLCWMTGWSKSAGAVEIFEPKVLLVGLNPIEDGENLAESFYYLGGMSAAQVEDYIASETIQKFKELSENTINYEVVKKINIDKFPTYTNGFEYNFAKFTDCTRGDPGKVCENQKFKFDHIAWIKDNQICEIAQENNVDEIWVIAAPYIMTWENFMVGPADGFDINGRPYIVPTCQKNYPVMNANYDRQGAILHTYGHRVEATMNYLSSAWKYEDQVKYWRKPAATQLYSKPYGQEFVFNDIVCGNAHFPSNATSHYNYDNGRDKLFTCKDWKNFPEVKGESEIMNCNDWGCNDVGWQKIWMGSLPRSEGEVLMTSSNGHEFLMKKNWWYYLLYPDNAIKLKKTATGQIPGPKSCENVVYKIEPSQPGDNSQVRVTIDRSNATSCQGNWDNVGLLVDGKEAGIQSCDHSGNNCDTSYKTTISSGDAGSHSLQLVVNGGDCFCNQFLFTTQEVADCQECSGGTLTKGQGNADCNDSVDMRDWMLWKQDYLESRGLNTTRNDWKSDFDCDGRVTMADLVLWKNGFREMR